MPSGRSTSRRHRPGPRPPVRERLRQIIEKLGVASKRTYTARGVRLTDESRLPVWSRTQNRNRISYDLNTHHPVLSQFEEQLEGQQARDFRRLLKLVAASLPVEALFADVSGNPQAVTPARVDARSLAALARTAWRSLGASGLADHEIVDVLRSVEPFSSSWESVADAVGELEVSAREATRMTEGTERARREQFDTLKAMVATYLAKRKRAGHYRRDPRAGRVASPDVSLGG